MIRRSFLLTVLMLLLQYATAQPIVTITDFSGRDALNGNLVTGMTTDCRGFLWVSTWGGLYRYDGYHFLCYKIRPGDGNELDNARIDDVQQDVHGNLICRSYENYYLYDFSTNKFRKLKGVKGYQAGRRRLYDSGVFTRDGYRLKVSDNTLYYYDAKVGRWQPLAGHIKMARVNASGIVWARMADERLCRIVITRQLYDGLDGQEHVLVIHRDCRGILWQANNDGSVLLRNGLGEPIGYLSPSGDISRQKKTFSRIFAIADDGAGRVFLGSRHDGLYVLDTEGPSYHVSHYTSNRQDPNSLTNDEVFSLLWDNGMLWIGTLRGGLNVMNTEQGKVVFLNRNNRCTNFPEHDRLYGIRSIVRAGSAMVLSTSDGIFTCEASTAPESMRFYHSHRIDNNPKSLASNGTMSVNYVKGKGLFVCTSHGGLCRSTSDDLLQDNLAFETWNTERGAPSDQTLQTFADGEGQLWVIFEGGLSKLDVATMTSTDFLENATPHTHTWTQPVTLDDGTTCFATKEGLLKTDLRTLRHYGNVPPIQITSLTANGKNIPYSLDADTITLAKDERNFSIEFAALEMAGTDHVEYAYRVEGRDPDWIKTGHNRTLSFFNLGAGTYHLMIRATDNNRIWNNYVRRVTIVVQPTFWETPWAWVIYTLSAIFLIAVTMLVVMYIYRLRLNADFEKRMTEMKLRYFTNISHDLRTPLTLIEGPVSEMLQDDTLTELNRDYLTLVRNNTRRMLTLVNQILDFRKIQNSKMHLLIERMDLKAELSEVMADFRYMADDHQIDFSLQDHTDEAAFIWGDRDKVQKIFFNLLSNAFKYTAYGKKIWIELECNDTTVSASVCDTGKGMPQHAVGRLFARFETILTDNYMKSSSGIGLSLVKELVTLHHAHISVDSQEGKGSRFKVTFQKGNQHFVGDENTQMMTGTVRDIAAVATVKTEKQEVNSDIRILVVEDDADMLRFVSGILDTNYQVLQAIDGMDGLEKATALQPDLIISDINMPRMNGWQMVETLKQQTETSHIPVVLLTANSTLDDRIRGAVQGVDDYIVKPFSTEYLRVRVAAILQKQQQQQQYFFEQFAKTGTVSMLELPKGNSGVERRLAQIDSDMMQQLHTFMEEHLADNTPIQQLAEHVGMSRTLFYNKIRSITGLTPVDFYRRYHVERSAQLMRDQGLTVSEACYRTGFSDPKYFSKVFKKFMGVTPSEYRNGKDSSNY